MTWLRRLLCRHEWVAVDIYHARGRTWFANEACTKCGARRAVVM